MKTARNLKLKSAKKPAKFRFRIEGSVLLEPKDFDGDVGRGEKAAHLTTLEDAYEIVEEYASIGEWLEEGNLEGEAEDQGTCFYLTIHEIKDED